jgi:hypothetical protein
LSKPVQNDHISRVSQASPLGSAENASPRAQEEAPDVIMVIGSDAIRDLFKAILDDDTLDKDFQEKVLSEAGRFLYTQFIANRFALTMQCDISNLRERAYNQDNFFNQGLEIKFGSLQRFFGHIPSERQMKSFIDKLNEEFNLNRRLGLFLLEKSKEGYEVFFNPTDNQESKRIFLNEPRSVARKLTANTLPAQDIFDSSELITLHMEDSFLQTLSDLYPKQLHFFRNQNIWSTGLQVIFEDPLIKTKFINELKEWNEEHNVKNRIGVYRFDGWGPFGVLWFQNSEGNQALEEAKKEMLTEQRIAELEEKYNIFYDPSYLDQDAGSK